MTDLTDLIDFLISDEAIVVYIVGFAVCFIFAIFRFVKRRKPERLKKQNTMELKRLAEDVQVKLSEEENNKEVNLELTKDDITLATPSFNNVSKKSELSELYKNVDNKNINHTDVNKINEPTINVSNNKNVNNNVNIKENIVNSEIKAEHVRRKKRNSCLNENRSSYS